MLLLAALLALGLASPAHAHLALSTAAPAADARLLVAPDAVRLTFTEAVELGLSSIVLTGPNGQPISLAPLATVESRDELIAAILGGLVPGSYTVTWQAVGRDGHPVRGEYGFVIEEGAAGLAPPVVDVPAEEEIAPPPAPAQLSSFSPQSPLYAGVRWLTFLGILGALGAIGFTFVLRSAAVRNGGIEAAVRDRAARGAAGLGVLAAAVLLISLPLRLQAQSHALFGAGITGERFSLLVGSMWGIAWVAQAVGAVLVLVGMLLARRGLSGGWWLGGAGALALVATPGMSGHAAAAEWRTVALLGDALHILGAGVWLGTLLVIVLVAVPGLRRDVGGSAAPALASLVQGFSPLALAAAGLVVVTGLLASVLNLTAVADLWTTGYGRLLLAKVFLVGIVTATGAYNWQRARPRMAEAGGDVRLVRSGGAELVAAALVVSLTAVLVAVPPPSHERAGMDTSMDVITEP